LILIISKKKHLSSHHMEKYALKLPAKERGKLKIEGDWVQEEKE
jgi:hypothetical protein